MTTYLFVCRECKFRVLTNQVISEFSTCLNPVPCPGRTWDVSRLCERCNGIGTYSIDVDNDKENDAIVESVSGATKGKEIKKGRGERIICEECHGKGSFYVGEHQSKRSSLKLQINSQDVLPRSERKHNRVSSVKSINQIPDSNDEKIFGEVKERDEEKYPLISKRKKKSNVCYDVGFFLYVCGLFLFTVFLVINVLFTVFGFVTMESAMLDKQIRPFVNSSNTTFGFDEFPKNLYYDVIPMIVSLVIGVLILVLGTGTIISTLKKKKTLSCWCSVVQIPLILTFFAICVAFHIILFSSYLKWMRTTGLLISNKVINEDFMFNFFRKNYIPGAIYFVSIFVYIFVLPGVMVPFFCCSLFFSINRITTKYFGENHE